MSEPARPIVGTLHRASEAEAVVVGRQVAVDQLLLALGELSRHHRYNVYCPVRQAPLIERQVAAAPYLSVHPVDELLRAELPTGLDVWHDSQFDTVTPFALRARIGAAYPITVVHHTLSYRDLLHDRLLPLLLAQPCVYDALVATSRAAARVLEKLVNHVAERFNEAHGTKLSYRGRFEQIPLGVDTQRFRPIDRRKARERFEIPQEAFVLLWVGRLSIADKADLIPLVQAFADLCGANTDRQLRLVIAGTQRPGERFGDVLGAYAQECGVGSAVQILTEMSVIQPWLPMLYASADVFVSPVDNVQETFGLTPVEAMACGVPQVVSDWDGYRDTVRHGETGFLVPTYWGSAVDDLGADSFGSEPAWEHLAIAQSVVVDMTALARSVQRLIDEPELCRRMGEASRRRAEERYSWEAVVARYEALWRDLAEQAEREPEPPFPGGGYTTFDYGRVFGHYASGSLDEARLLELTARGQQLLRGRVGLPAHYNDAWAYLDLGLMKRILAGFAHAERHRTSLTLERIVAVLEGSHQGERERARIRRHVAWLLKYGFVCIT